MENRQASVEELLEKCSFDQNLARDVAFVVSSQVTELILDLRGTTMAVSVPYMAPVAVSRDVHQLRSLQSRKRLRNK